MIRQTRSRTKQISQKNPPAKATGASDSEASTSSSCAIQRPAKKPKKRPHISDDSSSESDIENYLKPAHEIDLNSLITDIPKAEKQFSEIEKTILGDVNTLSESNSSSGDEPPANDAAAMEIQQLHLQRMQEHLQKIEEAKRHVQEYEAKKQAQKKKTRKKVKTEATTSIADLLSVGEKLSKDEMPTEESAPLDSDDFTSMSESEREDWEEVKESKEKNVIPKEGVQITVQMPGVIREKKGVDLVAAMKRRLNRIKKENQVFIHKVHLLCWIAHGNYVNTAVNNEKFLGLALSLIPSEQCYPADRTDLGYLEQILNWYRKTIQLLDQKDDAKYDLEQQLHIDISKKQASNKRILVFIFICILRALGIQVRLVMSLLPLPLRPPSSELCSLSTKKDEKKSGMKKGDDKKTSVVNGEQEESKSQIKKDEGKSLGKKPAEKKADVKRVDKSQKNLNSSNGDVKKDEKNKKVECVGSKKSKSTKIEDIKGSGKTNASKSKLSGSKENKSNNKQLENKTDKQKKKVHFIDSPKKPEQNALKTQNNKAKPNLAKIKMSLKVKRSDDTTQSSANTDEAKPKRTGRNKKIPQADGANDSDSAETSPLKTATRKPNLRKIKDTKVVSNCPVRKHEKRLRSLPSYKELDSEEEFRPRSPFTRKNSENGTPKVNLSKLKKPLKRSMSASPRQMDVRNDIINLIKGRIKEEKQQTNMKLAKSRRSRQENDDDSDYSPEPIKKKKHDSDDEFIASLKPKVKRRVQVKEENESETELKRKGNDIWVEVYLEAEEKWISVDVIRNQVHCVNEIYKRATQPVSYILAWDNKNYIKDISKRYCPNWNTVTRKLRVEPKWWDQTLKPFTGPKTARDREEDEELARLQLEKPLPTTIAE